MITKWDEYPIHQTTDPVAHVGTTDRNFYDRYYFNCHSSSDELFCVFGMGVYPNLGTQDAFLTVRIGDDHHVVRANQALKDRHQQSIGPFRIEVLEPLWKLRFVLDPADFELNGPNISCDLTWTGSNPVWHEPRHYSRKHGRVVFDTSRFAQNGRWEGTLSVEGVDFTVTPDRWWGSRDRSWGIRPIGEPEPPGIQTEPVMTGMWNYVPMQFDDHSIFIIIQEEGDGRRVMDDAVRVKHGRHAEPEWLGSALYSHKLDSGTRMISEPSAFTLPDAPGGPLEIVVKPLVHNYLGIGTGYGLGDEYRHGAWLGPGPTVESKTWDMAELSTWAWFAIARALCAIQLRRSRWARNA